jgi:exodeoxyribonuclease VII large subunit
MEQPYLTLSQLNQAIRICIEEGFQAPLWVLAEVSELNGSRGHTYMNLIEKQDQNVVAQQRATIWSSRAALLDHFETVTHHPLRKGMEVLLQVQVRYHEKFGLSLDVVNIMPEFTLGGLARKKQETIERLQKENLMNRNSQISLPFPAMRIAVISSPTAAGYQDFCHQIASNSFGYLFELTTFPSLMQGDNAEDSMIKAFQQISQQAKAFDAIVLIRGGGAQIDLSCFDGYSLASTIAMMPIPVITGIGHERDESVADMAAHTRCKTPTAVAEYLIENAHNFEKALLFYQDEIIKYANAELTAARKELTAAAMGLALSSRSITTQQKQAILHYQYRFADGSTIRMHSERQNLQGKTYAIRNGALLRLSSYKDFFRQRGRELELHSRHHLQLKIMELKQYQHNIELFDPINVLKRGFSITRSRGKVIHNAEHLTQGTEIETTLSSGKLISTVKSMEKQYENE